MQLDGRSCWRVKLSVRDGVCSRVEQVQRAARPVITEPGGLVDHGRLPFAHNPQNDIFRQEGLSR